VDPRISVFAFAAITATISAMTLPLPTAIRSRFVDGVNGLRMHVLEAGFEPRGRPGLLLLHGFPELAYSWRKVMLPLAQAGYHVIAPDQRGYGLTTGWDGDYDGDVASVRIMNLVRDAIGVAFALGHRKLAAVIGHDFGSPVAAWCALMRPDVFPAVALMSAPFAGAPVLPFDSADGALPTIVSGVLGAVPNEALAALPRPRKHYQWYYATRAADADMRHCKQGIHAFLRAYYHMKSADWTENQPFPLASWAAEELAKMPTYYIMDLQRNMAETVAPEMPPAEAIAACRWLTEEELRVYSEAFARTGFQAALNWYRCATETRYIADLQIYSGRTIDVPAIFIAGASDWGPFQKPGLLEKMRAETCTRLLGCHFIKGAGHWVQQEQPEETVRLLLDFLARAA
jgi:pimeloyl-ACP methyl ester carboxylesterase